MRAWARQRPVTSAGNRATGNRRPPLPFRSDMPPGCGQDPRQTTKSTHQQTTIAARRQKKATRLKNSRGSPSLRAAFAVLSPKKWANLRGKNFHS